jgi:hypothetical protein
LRISDTESHVILPVLKIIQSIYTDEHRLKKKAPSSALHLSKLREFPSRNILMLSITCHKVESDRRDLAQKV